MENNLTPPGLPRIINRELTRITTTARMMGMFWDIVYLPPPPRF